jgi:hypothetical protein
MCSGLVQKELTQRYKMKHPATFSPNHRFILTKSKLSKVLALGFDADRSAASCNDDGTKLKSICIVDIYFSWD